MQKQFSAMPSPDAALATWAEWYALAGFPIFPCQGKKPLTGHGFQDASSDIFTVAMWWRQYPQANIGLATGQGCWVMDEDPRHGGDAALQALVHQYGALPDSARVLSGGADHGVHHYFVSPDDGRTVRNKAKIGEGLDIQALGAYVILPPSIHPETGHAYQWDLGADLEDPGINPAPEWLLGLVTRNGDPAQQSTGAPSLTPGAPIAEGTRESTLVRIGAAMRHAGADYQEILTALDAANRRCVPPLPAVDLERVARSVTRYEIDAVFERPGGGPPAAPATGGGLQWGSENTPPAFDFSQAVTSAELVRSMLTPPRFLIDKLIPDGLTILAAPSKSYKSFFALSLALATIGQSDWCGAFPVEEQGPVVFFALESPFGQLHNRLLQLAPNFQPALSPYHIHFFSGMHVLPSFRQGLHAVLEQVIDAYHPRLIVIDPLTYLYRMGRQDDLASATLDLLWPLAEMASARGIALFCPEHLRKRSKEDMSVIDQLNGSFIKAALVHALLSVQREGEDFTIETTLRDAASQHLTMQLRFDDKTGVCQWEYKGSTANVAESQQESLKVQVLQELETHKVPLSVPMLIANLGLPDTARIKDRLRQILHREEKKGRLAVSRRGEYYWIEISTD